MILIDYDNVGQNDVKRLP